VCARFGVKGVGQSPRLRAIASLPFPPPTYQHSPGLPRGSWGRGLSIAIFLLFILLRLLRCLLPCLLHVSYFLTLTFLFLLFTQVMRKGDNMRVFANEAEVLASLEGIPGAGDVRAVDFSAIPFQVRRQRRARARWRRFNKEQGPLYPRFGVSLSLFACLLPPFLETPLFCM